MKNKEILEQPNGKTKPDPVLQLMKEMKFPLTQKNYLAIAYPEGITSEERLPEEVLKLPKK